MAILKHIASKNTDYGDAVRYLLYQHDEKTQEPILNENGKYMMRDANYMDTLLCDSPFNFPAECKKTNQAFGKNNSPQKIKNHHYIVSFDPADVTDHGLTGEKAQELGLEFAKKNFPGHQALVCTHLDGHHGSGNIHVHIVINSVRKTDTPEQPFTDRACDTKAGFKHHVSKEYLEYLQKNLMELCEREHLYQVDLLSPSEKKITEQEYWAAQRGQESLDETNQQMVQDGLTPRITKLQTEKEYLRSAIEDISKTAKNMEDFQTEILQKYKITAKLHRGRISFLHPDRNKHITGKKLGSLYELDYLSYLFDLNQKGKPHPKPELNFSDTESHRTTNRARSSGTIVFIQSNLRLVVDLQNNIKAQHSIAYARKVKLSNLKQMAQTVSYVQEHGIDTVENLHSLYAAAREKTTQTRASLKATEEEIRNINEQIHYTGQYLANKSIYMEFCKSKNKGTFRKAHASELELYEAARKFLKEKSGGEKLPTIKQLRSVQQELLAKKTNLQSQYEQCRSYEKELKTVHANVEQILQLTPEQVPAQKTKPAQEPLQEQRPQQSSKQEPSL